MAARPVISLNFSDCPPQFEEFFLPLLQTRYEIRRDDRPDFLIYSLTGHRHRLYNCTKIFVHHETYPPNWRECDYAILPVASRDPRHLYLPLFAFGREATPLIRGGEDWDSILRQKTRFCALLSNYADRTVQERIRFFHALNRMRKVDSPGRALNNTGFTGIPGLRGKLDFYRSYKFVISFENKDRPGWFTEKMYDPYAAHAVPIFWGHRGVKEVFNPRSFVHARDFSSPEKLAEHICALAEDPPAFKEMLQAPPFPDNRPPDYFHPERVLDFFARIFSAPARPVTQRRWFFRWTKWRLAKRNKLPTE
jgi:hypothetical protein